MFPFLASGWIWFSFKYFLGENLEESDRFLTVMAVFTQWIKYHLPKQFSFRTGSILFHSSLLFQCFSIYWPSSWHSLVLQLKAFKKLLYFYYFFNFLVTFLLFSYCFNFVTRTITLLARVVIQMVYSFI